jgi:hypothetical protein
MPHEKPKDESAELNEQELENVDGGTLSGRFEPKQSDQSLSKPGAGDRPNPQVEL